MCVRQVPRARAAVSAFREFLNHVGGERRKIR
jgi:hypothetical protein